MFFVIALSVVCFSIYDQYMECNEIVGRYYANHMYANWAIMFLTWENVYNCYMMNFQLDTPSIKTLYDAKGIIYGLHFYHILMYYTKMRLNDWIHHALMVGIVMPLTELIPPTAIVGHCLFFINGLPGMIDYTLLFLVRNELLDKHVEKQINRHLNIWIRCPGCVITTGFIIINMCMYYNTMTELQIAAASIMAVSVYWNGIYYMDQVVRDYSLTYISSVQYN